MSSGINFLNVGGNFGVLLKKRVLRVHFKKRGEKAGAITKV